jgi:hypothetical protein
LQGRRYVILTYDGVPKQVRHDLGIANNKTSCHAELVSAPHLQSRHYAISTL